MCAQLATHQLFVHSSKELRGGAELMALFAHGFWGAYESFAFREKKPGTLLNAYVNVADAPSTSNEPHEISERPF